MEKILLRDKDALKKDHFHKIFEEYLTKRGLRQTRQRKIILDAVLSSESHVDTETIANETKKIDKSIGLATVYRTLKMMTDAHILIEHNFGGIRAQFEFAGTENEHHDHLICNQCGSIFEFFDEDLENLQEKIAKKLGFVLKSHRMELFADCIKKDNCDKKKSAINNL